MTGRLLSPPVDMGVLSIKPLSGPRAVGANRTESIGAYVQTSGSPFALWRYQFTFHAMNGPEYRRHRGWITALHGGANATRWPFYDPDRLTLAEAGNNATPNQINTGLPWSNGESWSNGQNWGVSPPRVAVAASASLGATEILLADEFWGYSLDVGDQIGLTPFHFGKYMITERKPAAGRYRIWPPLRKAITTDDSATLEPVLAMRMEGEESATLDRGLVVADGVSITMVEVPDYDVRDYFTG